MRGPYCLQWTGSIAARRLAAGDGFARIALANRLMEARLLGTLLEPDPFRRMARHAVEQCRQRLGRAQAHVLEGAVDGRLLHPELVLRHALDAIDQLLDGP